MTDELRDQFLLEGRELSQRAGADLLALERNPGDVDLIANVFRAIHTLKGGAGLFDLVPLASLLHAAEDLLDALRQQRLSADKGSIDVLIGSVSQVDRWLEDFDARGKLPADATTKGRAIEIALRRVSAKGDLSEPARATPPSAWTLALVDTHDGPDEALIAVRYSPRSDCFFGGVDPLEIVRTVPGLRRLKIVARDPWGERDVFDPFYCNLVFLLLAAGSRAEIENAFRLVLDEVEFVELGEREGGSRSEHAEGAMRMLRVPAARVDQLAEVVNELLTTRGEIAHLVLQLGKTGIDPGISRHFQSSQTMLDRLLARLHGAVIDLRLVPLSPLLRRFPVLTREIAETLGKQVALSVRGETLEVDKTTVDRLFEPLLHLIRNAVDHGIESSVARQATGKAPVGTITLDARRVGDKLLIELSDDGKGIDVAHLRQAARERLGLDADYLASLSHQETLELIFEPGFSTSAKVSEVSGRGVGMDAVRNAIHLLGGNVSVSSVVGKGTTVALTLPFRIVMTPVVTVDAGSERFGIPIDAIVETLRLAPEQVQSVRHGQAFIWRNKVLPLLDLQSLVGGGRNVPSDAGLRAMVVGAGDRLAAIAVDRFSDRIDVLMRPLEGPLSGIKGISGTALTGDGKVLLVLNPVELVG